MRSGKSNLGRFYKTELRLDLVKGLIGRFYKTESRLNLEKGLIDRFYKTELNISPFQEYPSIITE